MEDNFLEQGWDLVRKGLETYDKFKEMKRASTKATDDVREEKKVLFIVQDCNVYEGDKLFCVTHILDLIESSAYTGIDKQFKAIFLTKEAAEKYIAHNIKSISFNELEDYLHLVQFDFKYSEQLLIDNVLKHFKPKP